MILGGNLMQKKLRYTIGLDIGIASVGWAALFLNENDEACGIVRAGVHTFNEAVFDQSRITGAAKRRGFRSGRRRTRRKASRIQRVKGLLQRENIISKKDIEQYFSGIVKDVYFLRWVAIQDEPVYILNNKELAQILIYFAKHRGYKSNTTYEQTDTEGKKVLTALSTNKKYMLEHGYRTVGEMLYCDEKFRRKKYGSSEERELLVARNSQGDYSHSIGRDLLVEEVKMIFNKQRELGNTLATEKLEEDFLKVMESQRNYDEGPGGESPYGGNLIEKMVGECTFEKGKKRACKASYTAEQFVLLEKLNHLRIHSIDGEDRKLTEAEREKIIKLAYTQKEIKYAKLRTVLKLSPDERFAGLNYSLIRTGDLKERVTQTEEKSKFVSLAYWYEIKKILDLSYGDLNDSDEQLLDTIGMILTCYKSDSKRREKLAELELEQEQIEKLLILNYTKFQNLSFEAMKKIIPELEKGVSYTEACLNVGYGSKEIIEGKNKYIPAHMLNEALDQILNPTVKRAVRRTIRILNELIKTYGSPVEVHVEMSRDLPHSKEVKSKIEKLQKQNEAEKKEAKVFICENFGKAENEISGKDILRYRLWKNQSQMDLYTGKMIPVADILDYEKYEIDHMLPYSRSFNDSFNNKMLVRKEDNQNKKNRTPYEYMRHDEDAWNAFVKRVNTYVLSPGRRKNATTKSNSSEEWMSRNLNDTRYTTKVVTDLIRRHLAFELYTKKDRKKHVYTQNGGITARLRYEWGLEKDRDKSDKHHAQDAIVIACCTDGMIKRLSEIYKREEIGLIIRKKHKQVDTGTGEILPSSNLPWLCFREEVEMFMADHPEDYIERARKKGYQGEIPKPIFVSRLPQKKKTGAISEATIYSSRTDDNGEQRTVKKTKLQDLKLDGDKIKDYYHPEDDRLLYNKLLDRLIQYGNAKDAFAEPFYKPRRDGSDGPIVKAVKTYVGFVEDAPAVSGGIAARGNIYRIDIFQKTGKYYMVPVYYKDLYQGQIPRKAVVANKPYSDWKEMDDRDFLFSLYTDDLIRIRKKGAEETYEMGYYKTCNRNNASLKYKTHDLESQDYKKTGIKTLKSLEKLNVDLLGNIYTCHKEEREWL